jgi:hypothetical protein
MRLLYYLPTGELVRFIHPVDAREALESRYYATEMPEVEAPDPVEEIIEEVKRRGRPRKGRS